jgi:hypothetical protein
LGDRLKSETSRPSDLQDHKLHAGRNGVFHFIFMGSLRCTWYRYLAFAISQVHTYQVVQYSTVRTVHTVDNGSKRRVSHRQSICPAFVWPFSELENAKIRLIVVVISAWIMAMMPMAVETLIEQSTSLSL